jgi:hypothetical protein
VTPGVFAPAITYILSCKWGLVSKPHVDDFFEVLKWSKEFGADTPKGRQTKQGVIGVFAGSSFDTRESVTLEDGNSVSLPSYAQRINVQLLKAADFNVKLHERGASNDITVQHICRIAKEEQKVREILEHVWKDPTEAKEVILKVNLENNKLFEFEKMQHYKEERKKYVEQTHELFKKILNEVANRTALIYDRGIGKDGSFSEYFVDSLYTDVFHLAKGEEPYYVKLDYEERENIVWVKEYDFGLVKSNNPAQKQKG